ncbi:MAG TPA: hypothetical protein VJQ82_20570 [Terriglobales bacterium]|nr:hypothetical protein [Terriglobales bacterium]
MDKKTTLIRVSAVALILLAAAIACAPMLIYGASNGHSIRTNLAWMKCFSAQLAQGDLYPRWLMDMNHGAGSPAFYYYAPLPFYITSAPASLFQVRPTIQLAWGEWLLLALSGMTLFWYVIRHFPVAMALPCAVLYMILPYHFEIDAWQRQDLGELANYIWMPLILHFMDELPEGTCQAVPGLAIGYALMLLSHLPSALLFSICLPAYVAVRIPSKLWIQYMVRFSAGIALGMLLSAIYWMPALFSQQYIHAQNLWLPQLFDFHRWFLPPNELLPHYPGVREFAERLFLVICASTAMFVLFWLSGLCRRRPIVPRPLLSYLVLVFCAWFLMCSCSSFVWETVPVLWKVQFPWRIAMLIDLATAVTAAYALDCAYANRDRLSALAVSGALALFLWSLITADFRGTLDPWQSAAWISSRDSAVHEGVDSPEYVPIWSGSNEADATTAVNAGVVGANDDMSHERRLDYDEGAGKVTIAEWRPRSIDLDVRLHEAAQITVGQFYFPNWFAKAGTDIKVRVMPAPSSGLLVLAAPAGIYRLHLALEPLTQERVGLFGTALGAAILLVIYWGRILRLYG